MWRWTGGRSCWRTRGHGCGTVVFGRSLVSTRSAGRAADVMRTHLGDYMGGSGALGDELEGRGMRCQMEAWGKFEFELCGRGVCACGADLPFVRTRTDGPFSPLAFLVHSSSAVPRPRLLRNCSVGRPELLVLPDRSRPAASRCRIFCTSDSFVCLQSYFNGPTDSHLLPATFASLSDRLE